MNVTIEIEELVLEGFAPGDRYRIGQAVERELARLFAVPGAARAFDANAEIARLDAGSFQLAPRANANTIGAQIAQSVHQGLSR